MAVTAWSIYNSAKEFLLDNTIDIDGTIFRATLHTSASNASDFTLSVIGSVTGEIADGNGYSTSGKTMGSPTWATGASAKEMRFDSTAVFWSANGGTIAAIKFLVLAMSGTSAGNSKLLAWTRLSTAQFSLTDTNRLTVTPSANGIFELN